MRLLCLVLMSVAVPATAAADGQCRASHCSGSGLCFEERGRPYCLCDEGYAAHGLECVASDVERPLRSVDAAELGERAVEVAMGEYGRNLPRIGRDLDAPPHALSSHLAPGEWWCTDFVAWTYAVAGIPMTGGEAGGWLVSGNDAAEAWFRDRTVFVDRDHPDWETFEPRAGDYVRFDTARTGHSAIVRHVEGDRLYTVEGNVDGKVFVNRYDDYKNIRQLAGFGVPMLDNEPPAATVDGDALVVLPETAFVSTHVEDDGPDEGLGYRWNVVTGPAAVAFDDPSAPETEVTFVEPGVYVLSLDVSDGELDTRAELSVEVLPEPEPAPARPDAKEVPSSLAGCAAAGRGPTALPLVVAVVLFFRRRRVY